jgi:E3 ubiquitin-protein ligase synoviolin
VWSLQRVFFGNLRPLEIEALSERGWIVATEWLFAMSTFRGEFGMETAILFLLLIVGKAWGWVCEGRIDTLDHQLQHQHPQPYNHEGGNILSRLSWLRHHGRLMGAVALNFYFVFQILWYCGEEVMLQARPGVMMMFVFEWAILLMNAFHLACKYAAWGVEQAVLKKQQKERIEELRREAAVAAGIDGGAPEALLERIPEEDLDVHDLDLPGWEGKGQFLFFLDILIGKCFAINLLMLTFQIHSKCSPISLSSPSSQCSMACHSTLSATCIYQQDRC